MHITRQRAQELNRSAYLEPGPNTPAIVVAGVAVHTYVDPEDSQVVVSVHLDTGDVPEDLLSAKETVPLRITVNGHDVFSELGPANAARSAAGCDLERRRAGVATHPYSE